MVIIKLSFVAIVLLELQTVSGAAQSNTKIVINTQDQDINECLVNNGNCSMNATCFNIPGGLICACKSGFTGNGLNCTDVNECLIDNGKCKMNAICINTVGSFICTCKPGYKGNGSNCTDINECFVNTAICSSDAICTNTPGGYTCTCKPGFTGNGLNCSGCEIKAVSFGCDDKQRTGYISINGNTVLQAVTNSSYGVSTVEIDVISCSASNALYFNTSDVGLSNQSSTVSLANYVSQLPPSAIIIGVTANDARAQLTNDVIQALKAVGVDVSKLGSCDKMSFIAYVGRPELSVSQVALNGEDSSALTYILQDPYVSREDRQLAKNLNTFMIVNKEKPSLAITIVKAEEGAQLTLKEATYTYDQLWYEDSRGILYSVANNLTMALDPKGIVLKRFSLKDRRMGFSFVGNWIRRDTDESGSKCIQYPGTELENNGRLFSSNLCGYKNTDRYQQYVKLTSKNLTSW